MLMKKLSVQSFNIHKIDRKSDCRQKVTGGLKQCPAVAGL